MKMTIEKFWNRWIITTSDGYIIGFDDIQDACRYIQNNVK